jgi:hypothetical protein
MKFELDKIRVPLWVFLVAGLTLVISILSYWYHFIEAKSKRVCTFGVR